MKIDDKQINLAVALLLDDRPEVAVSVWNAAGMTPQLARVRYDAAREKLQLTTKDGLVADLSLDELLAVLAAPEARAARVA